MIPSSSSTQYSLTPESLLAHHKKPSTIFSSFDSSSNGLLSLKDARNALRSLGADLTGLQVVALARQYGDGRSLDYKAFLAARGLSSSSSSAPLDTSDSSLVRFSSDSFNHFVIKRGEPKAVLGGGLRIVGVNNNHNDDISTSSRVLNIAEEGAPPLPLAPPSVRILNGNNNNTLTTIGGLGAYSKDTVGGLAAERQATQRGHSPEPPHRIMPDFRSLPPDFQRHGVEEEPPIVPMKLVELPHMKGTLTEFGGVGGWAHRTSKPWLDDPAWGLRGGGGAVSFPEAHEKQQYQQQQQQQQQQPDKDEETRQRLDTTKTTTTPAQLPPTPLLQLTHHTSHIYDAAKTTTTTDDDATRRVDDEDGIFSPLRPTPFSSSTASPQTSNYASTFTSNLAPSHASSLPTTFSSSLHMTSSPRPAHAQRRAPGSLNTSVLQMPSSEQNDDSDLLRSALAPALPTSRVATAALLRNRLSRIAGGGVRGNGATITAPELMSYLASIEPRANFVTSETVGSVVRRLQRPSLHPALDSEIPVDAIVRWLSGEDREVVEETRSTPNKTKHTRKGRGSSGSVVSSTTTTSPRFIDSNVSAMRFATFRASWENKHGAPARKEALLSSSGGGGEDRAFSCLHLAVGPPQSQAIKK